MIIFGGLFARILLKVRNLREWVGEFQTLNTLLHSKATPKLIGNWLCKQKTLKNKEN